MVFKSRLLTTAFIPVAVAVAFAPAWGFDVTGEEADADVTAPVELTANPPDAESIVINGTQGAEGVALILDDDRAVEINGTITIRDRESTADDAATYTLGDAVGVKISTPFSGSNLSLKSGLEINISEVLGPQDNDDDNDGIIEGSPAIDTANRIGLWVDAAVTGSLIGEGGFIRIDGNNARGVQIDDAISLNLDLSTALANGSLGGILGDNAIGVDINSTIGGYYRQRGDIDVRGASSVGIDIDADITGSLMIEALVNATGYSGAPSPRRGVDESGLTLEQQTANENERRRSGSAVNIGADIDGGVIIGGSVHANPLYLSEEENNALSAISDARGDETDGNVAALATLPYQFDDNRGDGRITTYGEAAEEASLRISSEIGAGGGVNSRGSVETLLDTSNDDEDDNTDAYASTAYDGGLKKFYYSHGLLNRGRIEANSWYDAVKKGTYQIDTKATAMRLDNSAIVHGGIYNSGVISANAYNSDAVAIHIDIDAVLNNGIRSGDDVLLNDNSIVAEVQTDTRSHDGVTKSSNTAIAIGYTDFAPSLAANPPPAPSTFVNRGNISAISTHTSENADTGLLTSEAGDNARAFDFAAYSGGISIRQEMLKDDELLLLDASAPNANTNPYQGGGDIDVDRNGDGAIDTRDTPDGRFPRIIGDIIFNDSDNNLTINAGTVAGDVSFGGGTDTLTLFNEIADDDDDDYTAPATEMVGRITKGSGALDVTIGERSVLHFDGQEGDADNETEGLEVRNLTLQGSGNLKFTIDASQLSDEVIHVTDNLTLADDARLTPALKSLFLANETKSVKLISYDNPVTKNNAIDTYLADETPFIYDVSLRDESSAIFADFSIKSANDLGLNKTEDAALNAVIAHFNNDDLREQRLTALDDGDDFRAAYRQLLPHYSDGTAQQLSGLADMATGAVSQHLQLINAGGRRGGDGWVQQFGDYRKQDASANGAAVSGTSYAIALGYDLPVSIIDALGLYLQMGFSAVNEKSAGTNEVTSESIAYGAYLSDQIGPLHYQLNAAYGFVDLESERLLNFSGLVDQTGASWDATSTAASARLAYPILQNEHVLRLEAGLDFFRLNHDDYSESEIVGRGFAMQVKGGASEKTSQFIGLRGGYRRGGGDPVAVVWEPNYYLGWRTTSDISPYRATTNFVGSDESFTLQSHIEPEDALDIGLGFAAHNDYFAFEFNYRTRIANDEETHGGGVSIRLLF